MKFKNEYKKIADKILFSDEPITKQDLETLNLFNSEYLGRLLEMSDSELKRKLTEIITRQSVVIIGE